MPQSRCVTGRALRGKPVGVGGARDKRGVLTTCNYEARAFGLHSAMPTFMALQRCPKLIVIPPRFDVYRKESLIIREIMHRFTPLVETLSLDEAYLDVTDHPTPSGALALAIRELIFQTTKLTASAGVGPNKLVAKIASDLNKPNGQFEVKPEEVEEFMAPLPARKLWGIGAVAEQKLERAGIRHVAICDVCRVRSCTSYSVSSAANSMSSAAASISVPWNQTVNENH